MENALTDRWRLVHARCADLRSVLPLHLGDIEYLPDSLGELENLNNGLVNSWILNSSDSETQ